MLKPYFCGGGIEHHLARTAVMDMAMGVVGVLLVMVVVVMGCDGGGSSGGRLWRWW